MGEFQEFTDALFGQLSVEIDEEKEIIKLASRASDDIGQKVEFKDLSSFATALNNSVTNSFDSLSANTFLPFNLFKSVSSGNFNSIFSGIFTPRNSSTLFL